MDTSTDLAMYTSNPRKYKQVNVEAKASDIEEEIILVDGQGNMIGDVLWLDDDEKVLNESKLISSDQISSLEQYATSCGRVFSLYKQPNQDINFRNKTTYLVLQGSGFMVSDNMAVTANHVVKKEIESNNVLWELYKVYITFRVSAQYSKAIKTDFTTSKVYQVIPPRGNVDPLFPAKYSVTTAAERKHEWKHVNDFCFLRFVNPFLGSSMRYVFPAIMPKESSKCFVIGYPAFISETDFVAKYTTENAKSYLEYEKAVELMNGFDSKVISLGNVLLDNFVHSNPKSLYQHTCQTIAGISGGLFAELTTNNTNHLYFNGIHIGGSQQLNTNFVLGVDRPEFAIEYYKLVLDCGNSPFLIQHKNCLQKFLYYHSKTLQEHGYTIQ